ncbi:hypothetical protein BB560_001326 [Smittium megazygosporum]|uniref:DUF1308 domain-containing protein n=1 Tax=Smittium megazygosporum TaxID=133381 RepID=A0A2T9ZHU9_9FUNG|nr:hypothetical protein BB560_001326 [Smittium megazygosporum]
MSDSPQSGSPETRNSYSQLLDILDNWKNDLDQIKSIYPAKKNTIQTGLKKFHTLVSKDLELYSNDQNKKQKSKPKKVHYSITIDIVADDGCTWIKVFNKPIHSYWKLLSILEADNIDFFDSSDSSDQEFDDIQQSDFGNSLSSKSNTPDESNRQNTENTLTKKPTIIQTSLGPVWDVSNCSILKLPFFKKTSVYSSASNNFLINFNPPKLVFLFRNDTDHIKDKVFLDYSNALFDKVKSLLLQFGIHAHKFNSIFDELYSPNIPLNQGNIKNPVWSNNSATFSSFENSPTLLEYSLNQNSPQVDDKSFQNQSSSIAVFSPHLTDTIVLDITSVCALISVTSHSNQQMPIPPEFYTPWLKIQQEDESKTPILNIMCRMFKNKRLVTTSSVYKRILDTASKVGGKNEYARFRSLFITNPTIEQCLPEKNTPAYSQGYPIANSIEDLWKNWLSLPDSQNSIPHIEIIDPVPSDRFIKLYENVNNPSDKNSSLSKKSFSQINLDVFGTADALKHSLTTANYNVCSLISNVGIHGLVIEIHAPRSLSEPRLCRNLIPLATSKNVD